MILSFIDTMTNIFSTLGDGFNNVINFIKSVPSIFNDLYNIIPSPFNYIIVAFIPLFVAAIFYKVARGY